MAIQKTLIRNPLVVALDVDSEEKALQLVDELHDIVGCFKIGPRLLLKGGPKLIEKIAQAAPVFLDHKFFDIPSTMVSAVKASFDCGVSLATIHLMAGASALQELAKLERELNAQRPFKLLGVSILTSWSDSDYPPVFEQTDTAANVSKLVLFGKLHGLTGFVCSGHELDPLSDVGVEQDNGDFLLVPGVRRKLDSANDQSRVVTPKQAMALGANAVVIGRPIIENANPREVAAEFAAEVFRV
jgi:orotidine-5'-phosphate decarboxylase